jgi:hypothetical protein
MKQYARRCDVTGRGINEGYVFRDGEMYASDKDSAIYVATKHYGYDSLSDCYDNGMCYYTEWNEVDEDEWYDEDGSIHILDNENNN